MRGDRLKELRTSNKLTQEELGKRVNVTKVSVSGYENGNRTPDTDTLQKIADFFEVTTDYLLGRSNVKKPASPNTSDDEREMKEFFSNPRLNVFFKEMADSPEEQLEELQEFWEIIKKRGLNKK
ncbi:helix-turn-helix transcriptional regulator [Domibacillus sp. A3M-37]|uniref:helix-turn-helix domain-containing protein n=1 Tax=Domibacillus sp. A3M-37 TaxID=2962037 RepID=UPI0020B6A3BF|nr:helix-turn-helix domain-containing protein [Domibacillus sp. A3M-37]MCP3763860.1 helix-turn-helix transcriptional regulator [Domibacillus sp. A3M-37]